MVTAFQVLPVSCWQAWNTKVRLSPRADIYSVTESEPARTPAASQVYTISAVCPTTVCCSTAQCDFLEHDGVESLLDIHKSAELASPSLHPVEFQWRGLNKWAGWISFLPFPVIKFPNQFGNSPGNTDFSPLRLSVACQDKTTARF